MRLESALYTSKEGLNVHGLAVSVIGDNIANANTVGFKSSRIEFGDLLAEGGGGRQSDNIPGGGNGVQVNSVRHVFETGVIESTNRSLDVAIEGRGFIMVGDTDNPSFTRAGNLQISQEGVLVNAEGLPVLGFVGGSDEVGVLDQDNLNLNGVQTSAASVFGNVSSEFGTTTALANPETFREIDLQATFTSPSLTVYDSLGQSHDVTLAFYKTDINTWVAQAYMDGSEVGGTEGTPVQIGADITLNFENDGTMTDANQANAVITAAPAYGNGASTGSFTIDLGGFTQFAGATQVASITQDGQGAGNITDYEILGNGEVYAVLDSGENLLIGQMRLADFANQDGLERAGNNLFTRRDEAGEIRLGDPGSDGFGTINGGALERSTVDIATEFVELVLFQRGYQANSQTLNAANELMRDTLNLLR